MKKTLVFLLVILLQNYGCGQEKGMYSEVTIEQVLELTRDEIPVYVVLDVVEDERIKDQILITNLELHWRLFRGLNDNQFLNKLREVLMEGAITVGEKFEEDYLVDKNYVVDFKSFTREEVYKKYFDDKGIPKDIYSEDEMKKAVAYLVGKGIIVQQGKYSMFNIYVPPD